MRKFTAFGCALLATASAWAADAPAITIHTDIYNQYGSTNHFTLMLGSTEEDYFDVDCGFGEVEYLIKPATWDTDNYSISGTPIDCTVGPDGIINIYGDPAKLNYIYAEGANLRLVQMDKCVNMEIVDLQHNELVALDLSMMPKLAAVYLTDNPFTPETPLVIGSNHPDLEIIEVDIVTYMDPAFDINTFTKLKSFDGYANKSLTHLDPTNCPELLRLSLDSTPVKSLDVTKNPNLMILNIEDTGITSIDVSKNPYLRELYASHASGFINTASKISSIDLTNNPNLLRLTLAGNALTELDLTHNPLLEYLVICKNFLTSFDASALKQVWEFDISNNYLNFATLPLPQTWYGNYTYFQRPFAMEKSYKVGTTLDFSDKVLRADSETRAYLYTVNSATAAVSLVDDAAYTYAAGKVTFNEAIPDSVYIQFTNTIFDEYAMTTDLFMVKSEADFGKPTKALSFNIDADAGTDVKLTVGLDGASALKPKQFFIDWGNGTQVAYQSTGAVEASYRKEAGGVATIYVPEGAVLTDFGVRDYVLYSIDLRQAVELRSLSLVNTGLYSIDLSLNRSLRSLNLEGNNLYSLDLRGANGMFFKNELHDLNISHNNLSSLKFDNPRTFVNFNADYNEFEEFILQDFDNIRTFSMKHNKLTSLNLAYFGNATSIDLSENKLSAISLPEMPALQHINLSDNEFSLGDLPYFSDSSVSYLYAPQAMVKIPSKAPGVDLSAQLRSENGSQTTFTWYRADGSELSSSDYVCTNGATRFLKDDLGLVYCVMRNSAFPDFTGDNCLRTTLVDVVGMPTNCIATFTTTKAQNAELSLAAADATGTALYIDWNGDGTDLVQYPLTDTYTRFEATTKPGANVKVYTYSADEKITVFSITGAAMSSFDGSKLTDCSTLSIVNAGLSVIKYPQSSAMRELNLQGNQLTGFDFTMYPNLYYLIVNNNNIKHVDLSPYPALQIFHAADNGLEFAKLDNPLLWQLDLAGNNLKSIDLSKVPDLSNLALTSNQLTELDLSACPELRAVQIDRNYFTFATLPPALSSYGFYIYNNQNPVEIECVDGVVDLSSQARVGDTETVYRWFLGVPEFDDNGDLLGEELDPADEYSLADGVTTFHTTLNGVMCVMTNAAFPKLYLYTYLVNVAAGVESVIADGADSYAVHAAGHAITVAGPGNEASLYTIDGRHVATAAFTHGTATFSCLARGIYILRAGTATFKVNL